jgi:DNA-3-methyladenine glycosylase I
MGIVEHRGRLRHRDRRIPDDHAVAFIAPDSGAVPGEDGLARPLWASTDPLLREYYDTEWGLPVRDEQGLYERICLEGFQAGLSWATILRKRPSFRAAFAGFNPDAVALFTEADVERLMQDPGIVRNRLKIRSAITNARATLALRQEGGLVEFVWQFKILGNLARFQRLASHFSPTVGKVIHIVENSAPSGVNRRHQGPCCTKAPIRPSACGY